ncbi:MAG TPA: glycoside hydrolase family 3 N-terminal domain-containing protein [Blastococcus sp.]|jgi:beta-glucosidase-like glycosyl hydrolase
MFTSFPAVHRYLHIPALLSVLALGPTACAGGQTPAPTAPSSAAAPTTPAAPAPTGPEAQVAAALAGLDRRAQVAQLVIAAVHPEDLDGSAELAGSGVGGIFLAGRPEVTVEDLAATTADWQSSTTGPDLWLAVDQEGGSVQTLKGPGFGRLPSAVEQGRLPAGELAALADGMAASLHGAGLNLNLAPVVDVVPTGTEAGNEPIGYYDRHYGSTGPEVVAAAGTVVDRLAAAGVTGTLKHFPGLGRVRGNTDTRTDVTDAVTTAGDEQVAAFAGTLARTESHPFVMMSSATYTQIDPAGPAAFSRTVVTDLLRGRLGFDGVVISDDLGNALAVSDIPPGERAVRFLAAGGTLVLTVDPSLAPPMIDAVLARSDADPAFAAVVDGAVRTALLAKAHAGLLPAA